MRAGHGKYSDAPVDSGFPLYESEPEEAQNIIRYAYFSCDSRGGHLRIRKKENSNERMHNEDFPVSRGINFHHSRDLLKGRASLRCRAVLSYSSVRTC
jgi:hypothetical protein